MPAGLIRESIVYLLLLTGEWKRNITHTRIQEIHVKIGLKTGITT